MKPKGRRVPPAQPGQRVQYQSGELVNSLDPVLRQNIEKLAVAGFEQQGRGLLMVEIDETLDYGIANAEFIPVMQLHAMSTAAPIGQMQPIAEAVNKYVPEREFVASVMNATPTLPGPQLCLMCSNARGRDPASQDGFASF